MAYPKIFHRTFHVLDKPIIKMDIPFLIYLYFIEFVAILPFIISILFLYYLMINSNIFVQMQLFTVIIYITYIFYIYLINNVQYGNFRKRDICDNLLIERII